MEDRRFFAIVMTVVMLLAAGEIAYGIYGPFTARAHMVDDFSSSNRAR